MPDGTKRETTNFNEVQEMVWPTRETQETPAEPSEFGSAQDANREDDGFAPWIFAARAPCEDLWARFLATTTFRRNQRKVTC